MDPNDLPDSVNGVPLDELTEEQREQVLRAEQARQLQEAESTLQEFDRLIQEEVRRQNEFIESNLWETDWTEVETVDIVTLRPFPTTPGEFSRPDIQLYRYGNEEEVPDSGIYYRGDAEVTLQRVDREEWIEIVERLQNEDRVPDDVSILTGSKGVSDDRDSLGEDEGADA
jgi:hypothetical protein